MQGASSAAADAAIKAILPKVQEMVDAVKPKEKPAEPTEIEALKTQVSTANAAIEKEKAARLDAEARAAEEKRLGAVADVVNGLPVADTLKAAFRKLVVSGDLDPSIGKPALDAHGKPVLVDAAGAAKPLDASLKAFLDANKSWQPDRSVAGGGALGGGALPPAGGLSVTDLGKTNDALSKVTTPDEQAAVIQAAEKAASTGSFFRNV
jgi:hypothetical protein